MTESIFDKQATQWWDADGPMRTLHHINPVRATWIQSVIPTKQCQLLDVGCGAGLFCEAMANFNHQVTGLDISGKLIKIAKLHAKIQPYNIHYVHQPVHEFALNYAEKFDVVTCLEMLEHTDQPEQIIAECANCCKPGGMVFFSTINRTIAAWLGTILVGEHLLGLIPKGTHQFEAFIKPSEIKRVANRCKLQLKAATGLEYNPFDKTTQLTQKLGTNYLLAFQKTC